MPDGSEFRWEKSILGGWSECCRINFKYFIDHHHHFQLFKARIEREIHSLSLSSSLFPVTGYLKRNYRLKVCKIPPILITSLNSAHWQTRFSLDWINLTFLFLIPNWHFYWILIKDSLLIRWRDLQLLPLTRVNSKLCQRLQRKQNLPKLKFHQRAAVSNGSSFNIIPEEPLNSLSQHAPTGNPIKLQFANHLLWFRTNTTTNSSRTLLC